MSARRRALLIMLSLATMVPGLGIPSQGARFARVRGTDTPGAPGADPTLVNDLDLEVTTGSATIVVRAAVMAGDGVANTGDISHQDFALLCTNCVRLLPPPRRTGRDLLRLECPLVAGP